MLRRRREADGVEREAAEEGEVVHERRGFHLRGFKPRADEAVNGVLDRRRGGDGRHGERGLGGKRLAREVVALRPILVFLGGEILAALRVHGGERGELRVSEGGPAGVGVRDFFLRREQVEQLIAAREAHREFADFRLQPLAADDAFEHEEVFAALGFKREPLLVVTGVREAQASGIIRAGRLLHLPVTAAVRDDELRLAELLAVHEQPRALERAKQDAMLARRQRDLRRGTEQERVRAVHAHATRRVFGRRVDESERGLGVNFRRCAGREVPVRRGGDALDDFHLHAVLGQLGEVELRRGRDVVEAVLQAAGRERAAVDGDLVDEAVERAAGLRAHRGTNPQLVVVHDRRRVGLAAHVPSALDLRTVNVALDARALTEGVSHRDVMPAGAGREAVDRSPAMPVLLRLLL